MTSTRVSDLLSVLAVARGATAADAPGALAAMVMPGLARLVGSDLTIYSEVDTRTARVLTVEHPPGALGVETVEALRRFHGQHPLIDHVRRTGDAEVRRISDFLPRRRFRHLDLYEAFFRPLGIEHQMATAVVEGPGPFVATVTVNRRGGRDFTERDRAVLDLLRPHLAAAHRRVVAGRPLRPVIRAVERDDGDRGHGAVVLAADGAVRQVTEPARRVLGPHLGALHEGAPLPAPLADWVHGWRRPTAPGAAPRRHLVLTGPAGGLDLWFERSADECESGARPESRRGAPPLTPREAQVLAELAQGATNVQVALALGISARTVHKHLEHVFAKLGVDNRTAAARWWLRR